MTQSDYLALLAAVCAAPDDDAPRLVLADWLDIDGPPACRDAERAEFIRVQVGLARTEHNHRHQGFGGERCRACPLQKRSYGLIADHGWGWCDGLLGDVWKTNGHSKIDDVVFAWFTQGGTQTDKFGVRFHRGFPHEIQCTAADWPAHGDALSWSPDQTEKCPKWTQGEPNHSPGGAQFICGACKGTGRVPRPCPPTAQPVTEVRLEGFRPAEHVRRRTDNYVRWCQIVGRDRWHQLPLVNAERDDYAKLFAAEWPAVKTWHLPPEPVNDWQRQNMPFDVPYPQYDFTPRFPVRWPAPPSA